MSSFKKLDKYHLNGDQCSCVKELNYEGEIEVGHRTERRQDDQNPEDSGDIASTHFSSECL